MKEVSLAPGKGRRERGERRGGGGGGRGHIAAGVVRECCTQTEDRQGHATESDPQLLQAMPATLLVFCPELSATRGGPDPHSMDLSLVSLQDGPSFDAVWTYKAALRCTTCIFVEATVRCAVHFVCGSRTQQNLSKLRFRTQHRFFAQRWS